jgi:hypothetical protein
MARNLVGRVTRHLRKLTRERLLEPGAKLARAAADPLVGLGETLVVQPQSPRNVAMIGAFYCGPCGGGRPVRPCSLVRFGRFALALVEQFIGVGRRWLTAVLTN